MSPPTKNWR